MAARYWVGGTAAWDGTAGTKWALTSGGAGGQAVPTSADDVFFTAASGAVTCTISTGNTGAKSITCTGFTGTLAGSATLSVAGSFILSSGMTYTYSGSLTITATGTITTFGNTLNGIFTVNAPGGTVTLGGALTLSSVRAFVISAGTFTTSASNYSVTAQSFLANTSGTKVINLNGSTISVIGTNGQWNLTYQNGTNVTLNAGTSTIILSGASSDFFGAGLTYRNVSFTYASPITIQSINGTNTFFNLTLTAPSTAGVIQFSIVDNQTITTLVASGTSAVNRIFLASDTLGTARTITATTWTTVSDVDFRDITLTNAKSGTRLGNAGGNTGITFVAAKTVYWNLAGAQNWSATGWATSSGGSPSINNFPLAQDTAVFDESGAITSIAVNSLWNITTVDMSARTSAMTFTCGGSNILTFYGNLVTGSGTTFSGTGRFVFSGRVPQTITTAGKTITQVVEISSVGSSVTLQDSLTVSVITVGALTLTQGTFDANGYNVTTTGGGFTSSNSNVRTLAIGSGTWTIGSTLGFSTATSTNLTVSGSGIISFTNATSNAFNGGGADYSGITINQGGAGQLTIAGSNTLGNISNSYSATGATTIILSGNQIVSDFTASGQSGRVLTLKSSVDGTARTLTKTSGTVGVNFLSIRDSTATGGADWYAGANSTNVSNNTGWIFSNAPLVGGGSFIAFFM